MRYVSIYRERYTYMYISIYIYTFHLCVYIHVIYRDRLLNVSFFHYVP